MKLTEPLSYRAAAEEDMPDIERIVGDARRGLRRFHIDQWQGSYPSREDFLTDIRRGECFVVLHGGEVAGFFTLSLREEECYASITDGKWTEGMAYCVVHRAAVAAKYRGTGMSRYLMKCVEQQAAALERRCIRADTHRKNKPMQTLLRECGYRYRGNVTVDSEPGHDPARQAFEKILKK